MAASTTTAYASGALTQSGLIVWSNLGPLTTVYTAPPSCATRTGYASDVHDGNQNLIAEGCRSHNTESLASATTKTPDWLTCGPSPSALASIFSARPDRETQSGALFTSNYYSPGLMCPSGYVTASSFTVDTVQMSSLQLPVVPTTGTHIACCPSAFPSYDPNYAYCVSTATAATTVTNLCYQNCSTALFGACATPSPLVWEPSEATVTIQAINSAVHMVHQQSDVSLAKTGNAKKGELGLGSVVSIAVVLAGFVVGTCAL